MVRAFITTGRSSRELQKHISGLNFPVAILQLYQCFISSIRLTCSSSCLKSLKNVDVGSRIKSLQCTPDSGTWCRELSCTDLQRQLGSQRQHEGIAWLGVLGTL